MGAIPYSPVVLNIAVDGVAANGRVVSANPTIGWALEDSTQTTQTEYEIAVSSDDDWTEAEMWSRAPVASGDTFAVYGGMSLIDGHTYFLRLRIHNGVTWSEWHYSSFGMNSLPSVPMMSWPAEEAVVTTDLPTLWFLNSIDAEGDTIVYDFSVTIDTAYG